MAEEEGFEPPVSRSPQRFSKPLVHRLERLALSLGGLDRACLAARLAVEPRIAHIGMFNFKAANKAANTLAVLHRCGAVYSRSLALF